MRCCRNSGTVKTVNWSGSATRVVMSIDVYKVAYTLRFDASRSWQIGKRLHHSPPSVSEAAAAGAGAAAAVFLAATNSVSAPIVRKSGQRYDNPTPLRLFTVSDISP